MDALSSSLPPHCLKAVKSLVAHWDGFTLFLDRPAIPLDNNSSWRALRQWVTSRKNCRGAGAPWSASLAAWIYTLFATWSLHGLNIHPSLIENELKRRQEAARHADPTQPGGSKP